MLAKTVEALKAVEEAIKEEYEGVKDWHASARGTLEEVFSLVTGARERLEKIEPPVQAETPTEPAPEPEPESTEVTTSA